MLLVLNKLFLLLFFHPSPPLRLYFFTPLPNHSRFIFSSPACTRKFSPLVAARPLSPDTLCSYFYLPWNLVILLSSLPLLTTTYWPPASSHCFICLPVIAHISHGHPAWLDVVACLTDNLLHVMASCPPAITAEKACGPPSSHPQS